MSSAKAGEMSPLAGNRIGLSFAISDMVAFSSGRSMPCKFIRVLKKRVK